MGAGGLVDALGRDVSGVHEVLRISEPLTGQTLVDVVEHADVLLRGGLGDDLHDDVRP
ncbi:hypothetical protein [Streptomyces sp. Tue6028]|uniref:hypothetical protein n=1 Tax=Streptomyces sp. Tue6028 TaxID=2036037 RepID=UPI003EC1570E